MQKRQSMIPTPTSNTEMFLQILYCILYFLELYHQSWYRQNGLDKNGNWLCRHYPSPSLPIDCNIFGGSLPRILISSHPISYPWLMAECSFVIFKRDTRVCSEYHLSIFGLFHLLMIKKNLKKKTEPDGPSGQYFEEWYWHQFLYCLKLSDELSYRDFATLLQFSD